MIPLINGEAYSWGQIVMNILGTPIAGVTAITYDDKQEITNNWGAGNFPVSRGFGKIEATGKVTLMMEEIEPLTTAAPARRLQNIPEFDITVSFVHPNTAKIVTHVLKNCRFMNNGRDHKQGDTAIEKDLELVISHILW